MFVGAMKEPSPPTANGKDEVKLPAKDESQPWLMKDNSVDKEERKSSEVKVIEERDEMESVYSQSPPPSSLPFPKFSMTRPKANVRIAGTLA